jgi:hypothetical protein
LADESGIYLNFTDRNTGLLPPSNECAACLEGGFLTAYRWSGEKALSPNNIIYVAET